MAKTTLSQWDETAANNTVIGGISLAEGVMTVGSVNNAFRELMAQMAVALGSGQELQPYDATLTSIAALGTAADKVAYTTGVDTWAEAALTSFGRSLIDDATASDARTTMGVAIGTDVQAFHANLADIAAITQTAGDLVHSDGTNLVDLAIGSAGDVLTVNTGATAPEWAAPSVAVVSEKTASSSARVQFTASDLDTTNYSSWVFEITGLVPATDGAKLRMRVSTGGTFNNGATDYAFYNIEDAVGESTSGGESGGADHIEVTVDGIGNAAGETGISGEIVANGLLSASIKTGFSGVGSKIGTGGAMGRWQLAGGYNTAEANDGVRFYFDTGNVASGSIKAIGRK